MTPAIRLAAALTALACVSAHAGDVKAGRAKAAKCEVCHGIDGQAKIPEAPNLSGQVESYLVEQLKLFKGGQRQNDMMSAMAGTLSEQDIADLAAYYAAIQVTIGKVPGQ
jgi:cytochrome c553